MTLMPADETRSVDHVRQVAGAELNKRGIFLWAVFEIGILEVAMFPVS